MQSHTDSVRSRLQRLLHAPAKQKAIALLTVLGFAVPTVAYLAFVVHYWVNVPVADEWVDVALVERAFAGHLTFGALWAQHNENRMLFPNLIVVFLGYTTHLDVRIELLLSALLLLGSIGVLVWMHRRRSPRTPLLWYCPVAILMLSWVQYENSLWGFQMAWYLCLACLVVTLAVLDRPRLTAPLVALGALVAIVGSYSSLQGLIVWPAAFVLLLYRRRPWQVLAAWAGAAAATTAIYFLHFERSQLSVYEINPLRHPVFAAKLFVFSLGNIAGKPLVVPLFHRPAHDHPVLGTASPWLIAFGVVVLAVSVLAVVRTGIRTAEHSAAPIGVALILFALVFDALTAAGRGLYGYAAVSESHYTTYNMLALVGSYLIVISRLGADAAKAPVPRARSGRPSSAPTLGATVTRDVRRVLSPALHVLPFAVVACVGIAVVFGYHSGASDGRTNHTNDVKELRTLRQLSGKVKPQQLTYLLGTTPVLIEQAVRDHLSLYDSP